MKPISILTLLFALLSGPLSAQTKTFYGRSAGWTSEALDAAFSEYSVFSIDTKALRKAMSEPTKGGVRLNIDGKNWTLRPESAGIAPAGTPVETEQSRSTTAFDPTFKGFTQQGLPFRLCVNDGFVAGMLPLDGKDFFIEPAKNIDERAASNLFVLYEKSAWRARINRKCLVTDVEKQFNNVQGSVFRSDNCVTVELAVATDLSMYQKYSNSTSAVQNRVASIMNLVEGLYQNAFSYKIKFSIVTWYQSTSADPWTGSTSAGTVLDNFSSWGPGGFKVGYDLGQFWTNRNFDGSTIGIAWVGGVCSGKLRHHAIQDFSSSDAYMRCLVAHEIGHNFNMTHNSDIMAPSVSTSTSWSGTSVSQMNSYLPSVVGPACLNTCATSGGGGSSGTPPIADFSVAANDTFCTNRQIQFEDRSRNDPYTYLWTFEGGTPANSALQNPKVLYKNPGTYKVTLTATNAYGSNTKTVSIIAVAPPVVSFAYKINGLAVDFTNTSSGTATWLWKFGDGKTSVLKNPSHTYANNGSFNVQLSATNSCGTKIASKLVPVIAAAPVAAFSVGKKEGCAPMSVQLDNSSSNAQTFIWSLPGAQNSTSSDKNPVATYHLPGNYDIVLVAFNGNLSDTFTMKNAVVVRAAPVVDFDPILLDGGLVQFKNRSSASDSLIWDFGDGNLSSDSLPAHSYQKSGTYTVRLSAINRCGTAMLEKKINILLAPVAGFLADSRYTVCKNEKIRLKNNSSPDAERFLWSFPQASPDTSSERNPEISYNKSGTYDIRLVAVNGAGTDTFSRKIVVIAKGDPVAIFSDSTAGLAVFCKNLSTSAQNFVWDFGDGSVSNESNPIHTYATEGVYQIRLQAKNECDSSEYIAYTEVFSPPLATGFSHTADSFCARTTIAFRPEVSANTRSLHWYFEGGSPSFSTDSLPQITYDSAGVFDVALVAINPAGKDSLYKKDLVKIQSKPLASFTASAKDAELTFTNTSQRGREFHWDFGDGNSSVEPNPVHIYKQKGVYVVRLRAENECGNSDYSRGISLDFTADRESNASPAFSVFPNPTSGLLTVLLQNCHGESTQLIIRNAVGQEIIRREIGILPGAHSETFDLSNFPKGNYLLELQVGQKSRFLKVKVE